MTKLAGVNREETVVYVTYDYSLRGEVKSLKEAREDFRKAKADYGMARLEKVTNFTLSIHQVEVAQEY